MSWITGVMAKRRMIAALVLLLALSGAVSWKTMIRQEDPAFPYRYGFVLVQFPGADVEQVERLVAKPLEEEISEVEQVEEIQSIIRAGFVQLIIGMKQTVYDTDTAWDRLRVAVERARARFPEGVGVPLVDDRQVQALTAVLGISGSDDIVELQAAGERLKNRLYELSDIMRVRLYGDSGEQVTIALDDARIRALGITPEQVAGHIASRNTIVPGGFVEVDGRQTLIRPQTEFRSIAELATTPLVLADGRTVPLSAVADVRLEVADPPVSTAWVNDRQVVAVGVTVQRNALNVVKFGDELREFIDGIRSEFAPLEIEEMMFQPARVEDRLDELGRTLLLGVAIVAGLLILFMGPRMGLVVALIVPLVTLSSVALFAMGGGVLHQMAIAGMVIALGMLVDNAIVMVENIQWHMDQGLGRIKAAEVSVRELARPLGAATGTTLAVFVPMLIARGDSADFTRMIPVTIILMLAMSYLYALLVSPLLSEVLLVRRAESAGPTRMRAIGRRIGGFAVRRSHWIAVVAVALVGGAVVGSGYLERDFFPNTDRNQMIVDVDFPEGTPIRRTTDFVKDLSLELQQQPNVNRVFAFTGSSGPRFFYNMAENPNAPQTARIVVETVSFEDIDPVLDWMRTQTVDRWPDVQVVARKLAQGPPTPAPVELRLIGTDRQELAEAVVQVTQLLREIPGTEFVRHDMGTGIPSLRVEVDDALADTRGLSRVKVARALATQTQGIVVGTYRGSEDPVPIRLRSPEGSLYSIDQLLTVNAYGNGLAIPVLDTGRAVLEWQQAVIRHWNLHPVVNVRSELENGVTYATIFDELDRRLPAMDLPASVRMEPGGNAESSNEANAALYRTLPIGMILLLFFLLLQFNSFRRVGIVLITVPLAITGVVPGLILTGNPFGFMSLLGVIALVGIVVNNAIVLIDVIDSNMAAGVERSEAVIKAVERRARPILLTTATTVAGLLPLTLTQSTLWPPMAWAIISGLLASTVLTLGVVPALCNWFLNPRELE
ncbi:MAG: efflux RND transporter permease subunit [Lysobacterales bacterium]